MTGSLAAQITIPIIAFILLAVWVSMVYYADSHPYWKGRGPAPRQLTTELPSQAVAAAEEAGVTITIPAQATQSPEPPEPAATPEPAQAPEPAPASRQG